MKITCGSGVGTVIVFHRPFENGWDLYISFWLKTFLNVTSGLIESKDTEFAVTSWKVNFFAGKKWCKLVLFR